MRLRNRFEYRRSQLADAIQTDLLTCWTSKLRCLVRSTRRSVLIMASAPSTTGSLNWNIDSTHSSIDFSVRHMGIFTVRGSLGSVTGTVATQDETLSSLSLSIDVSGISTNNEQRDGHLKSADFLNVAEYPTIEFKSDVLVQERGRRVRFDWRPDDSWADTPCDCSSRSRPARQVILGETHAQVRPDLDR